MLFRSLLLAEPRQRGPEQFLEQSRRTMLVGVGQSGSAGRFSDAEMDQAAQTTRQPIADLAQGIGASELAKEHGDELRPAGKSLGSAFGAVLLDKSGEFGTRKMLEKLIEQAGSLYDCLGPPCGRRSAKLRQGTIRQRSIIGGPSTHASQTVLDKSDLIGRM